MERTLTRVPLAPLAGLVGAAAVTGSAVAAGIAYRGTEGEAYSPLNHFVSELGERGVSSLAALFNGGLIVGGICFAVIMVGLGRIRSGLASAVTAGIGLVAGVAGSLVGVYPIHAGPHWLVASTYFFLSAFAIAMVSLDVLIRPDHLLPRILAVVGWIVVAVSSAFIWSYLASGTPGESGLQPGAARPAVDPVTILEWGSIAGVVAWTGVVGAAWARASRRGTA